jgi:hypothetical protein
MTAGIGLALEAGISAGQTGINIGNNIVAEIQNVAQIKGQKQAEKILFRRRLAETALSVAGGVGSIRGSVGTVVEGRSLALAANNVIEAGARTASDDAFVTTNRLRTLDREVKAVQQNAKAARTQMITDFVGNAVSLGAKGGESIAANNELSTQRVQPQPSAPTGTGVTTDLINSTSSSA